MELLGRNALSRPQLEKRLTGPLSEASRKKLIGEVLNGLKNSRRLYQYPKLRGTVKYSPNPPAAAPYMTALKKEFNALLSRLSPAGITRDQILAELSGVAPPVPPVPAVDFEPQVLEKLKGRPGGLSISELRVSLGGQDDAKPGFDRAVLSLYRTHRVYLDRHTDPSALTDSDRQALVPDETGNYYIGITLRGEDD